jgi:transposase
MRGGAAPRLALSDDDRRALEATAQSPSLPHRQVRQAQGLLFAAEGLANEETGRRVGVSSNTVRAWRASFGERGVDGVGVVAKGRGRGSWLPEGAAAEVVRLTLNHKLDDSSTHWSTRAMAAKVGISKDSVAKIWKDLGVKPWQTATFKVSADPDFEAKLRDVVGVYLNPPARAVVFSFDEKPQGQALDRTQPSLPMRRGRAKTMTHDYKRNGTTDLFAALNVGTGEMITECRANHTAADVMAFFKRLDKTVPRSLDVHVTLTTSPPTEPPKSPSGWSIPAGPAGTSTSCRPRARGSTWSSDGSKNSPTGGYAAGSSTPSPA